MKIRRIIAVTTVAALTVFIGPAGAEAAPFAKISNSADFLPAKTANPWVINVDNTGTTTTIRCVKAVWSVNADGTGGVPTGFSSTAATHTTGSSNLVASWSGWAANVATNGTITLTNATGSATNGGTARHVDFANLTNGSVAGTTYYTSLSTYSDAACTQANVVENGFAAFQYSQQATVGVIVDPTMAFTIAPRATQCSLQSASGYITPASATTVDLGRLTAATLASGAHDLTVDTNANSGAFVTLRGAQTTNNLRSATAQPFVDSTATPTAGTATFGFTVNDATSTPGTWKALSQTPVQVASSATQSITGDCVGFTAAASSVVPAGPYNAMVYYTAVPRY